MFKALHYYLKGNFSIIENISREINKNLNEKLKKNLLKKLLNKNCTFL